jgi:glycosyltransferase involved in cell wall biosynthesis
MRVAYVTPYYSPNPTGRFGRFHDWVHTLRDESAPFEFDIHAFTATSDDGTLASLPHETFGKAEELWGSRRNRLEHARNAPRVAADLRAGNYDIVHVIHPNPVVLFTAKRAIKQAGLVLGPNVGGWFPERSDVFDTDGLETRVKFNTKQWLVNAIAPDLIIAFSEYHRTMLAGLGVPHDRISVLKAGVTSAFSPGDTTEPGDPPELLYVGDFSTHKGYPIFLKALAKLDSRVTARVVGAGNPQRERIEALGLDDRVAVEGFVNRDRLPDIYRKADLFVFPSLDETAGGNVQMEALACGLPVVVTDAPGISEFSPPEASVTFAPRTAAALSAAIERALAQLPSLQAAAHEVAPEYRVDRTIERLTQQYEYLVA